MKANLENRYSFSRNASLTSNFLVVTYAAGSKHSCVIPQYLMHMPKSLFDKNL